MYGMPKKRRTLLQVLRSIRLRKDNEAFVDHSIEAIKAEGALQERINIVKLLESHIAHEAYECKVTCVAHTQISNIMSAEGKYE
jgi:hypothetical protein